MDLTARDVTEPLVRTEEEMVDAADALRHASESIERHVEVIEGLATSVGPLRDSVVQLTATMNALVDVLGPLAAAERGMHNVEHDVEHVERGIGNLRAPSSRRASRRMRGWRLLSPRRSRR